MMKIQHLNRHLTDRSKGLEKLGVSEEDVRLAEKLIHQNSRCSEKVLQSMGTSKEEADLENAKMLGSLGVAGRRRSFIVIDHPKKKTQKMKIQQSCPNIKSQNTGKVEPSNSPLIRPYSLPSPPSTRSKGLDRLGVNEDDVLIAEKLLEQPSMYRPHSRYSAKALKWLGASEEEIDLENAKTMGSLGISGRRRSIYGKDHATQSKATVTMDRVRSTIGEMRDCMQSGRLYRVCTSVKRQ